MNIRRAEVKDLDELIRIRLAYLNEDYNGLTEEQVIIIKLQLTDYYKNHLGRDFVAFIAEEENRIISSAFLVITEKPANPSFITGKTGTVLNVYTEPDYRRQGIAGQLMRLAMEEAKERKLSFLELSATADGYPLYQKLGFEETKSHCVPMKYVF